MKTNKKKTISIYSQDFGMEFWIEKCTLHIMEKRKKKTMEEIELPNKKRIWTVSEKENYTYLEIAEADTIKHTETKEKKKGVPHKNKKTTRNQTLLQKFNQKNK